MAALLFTMACTTAQINQTLGVLTNVPLSREDVGNGLKEALRIGITKGAQQLAQEKGFYDSPYRILLPEEARKVTERLSVIPGFTDLEDVIIKKINQGAEDAAKEAAPIFVSAIQQMTIQDAFGILKGDNRAATSYLDRVTRDQLYAKFNPVIVNSLDKFGARKAWSDASTRYNSLPLVNDVTTNLDDYITQQALNGLFAKVAEEEINIRTNLGARTTDLLRRVFAAQDEGSTTTLGK